MQNNENNGKQISFPLAMGIDLGTSGVKVGIYAKDGLLVSAQTEEYPLLQPQNGYAEQNPEDWWAAVLCAMKTAVARLSAGEKAQIAAIGLSGQMHGLCLLDSDNKVVRPAILWCDGRTSEERNDINALVGEERILEITANPAIASFTAAKLLWVRKNEPQNYKKAAHALLPKDYIRFKLCGEYATDVSDASGTQLLDIKNRCWSDEVLEKLSIDKALLPKVYESADITGRLFAEIAEQTGLKKGLPIAGGGGDNAAAAVGIGVVRDEKAFTTIGTSGVMFAHTSQMRLDPQGRVHTFCAAVRNEWHVMGVTQAAGLSMKWLRDSICTEETAKAREIGRDEYAVFDEMAAEIPIGANRLIYLPYLMGERTPHLDPNARGVLFGLSAVHGKADIIRAVLEGVSYSLEDCASVLSSMGVDISDMAICGGGAKSPFWQSMLADIFNIPLKLPQSNEGACLGAAILGFCAAEVYESVQTACDSMIKFKKTIAPNLQNTKKYSDLYKLYHSLYPALKESFKELAKL